MTILFETAPKLKWTKIVVNSCVGFVGTLGNAVTAFADFVGDDWIAIAIILAVMPALPWLVPLPFDIGFGVLLAAFLITVAATAHAMLASARQRGR